MQAEDSVHEVQTHYEGPKKLYRSINADSD